MNSSPIKTLFRAATIFALAATLPLAICHAENLVENSTATPLVPGLLREGIGQLSAWDGTELVLSTLVGADRFYENGIWGQATTSANVEAGRIWPGHEVTSQINDYYVGQGALGEFDWHATMVGSVIAGYDPNVVGGYPFFKLGMAPGTRLSSGAIATSWSAGGSFDITPASFYSTYNHYFSDYSVRTITQATASGNNTYLFINPTDVINSSWGYEDPAARDDFTKAAGGLARANPLTALVVAAGNANTPTNFSNNVGGPASSPNVITVGATGSNTVNGFNAVADFSSRGPQDYYDPQSGLVKGVRAPVDLVAPGTLVVVAYYGGETGGNGPGINSGPLTSSTNDYYAVDGTSFAAPIVSGGVSLLKSLSYLALMGDESRDTRVIKSVLMNSATKLPGWDNGQHLDASGLVATTQSLDWAQGAGMLNLNRAFDQFYSGTTDVPGTGGGEITSSGWDYGSLELNPTPGQTAHNDYPIHFTLQATAMMDVTLSWFRNLGNPVLTDNTDPLLQSLATEDLGFADLNLEIWNADFTKRYAASQSRFNEVEELHFQLPETGEYAIRVTYDSQVFGAPVKESYGLAWNSEPVPEPGETALLGTGCLLLGVLARRRLPLPPPVRRRPCILPEV